MEIYILKKKKGAKNCTICDKTYSIRKREHFCKRCFRSICQKCSEKNKPIYSSNGKKQFHKLCTLCYGQSFKITSLKKKSQPYNTNSELGLIWLKKVNKSNQQLSILQKEFNEMRNQRSQEVIKYLNGKNDLQKGLSLTLNYSYRQIIWIYGGNPIEQQLINAVDDVIVAVLNKNKNIKLNNRIIYSVLFFQLFCSQTTTYLILSTLLSQAQTLNLDKMYILQKLVKKTNQKYEKIKKFLQRNIDNFIFSLTLNQFCLDLNLLCIEKYMEHGLQGLIQMIICILFQNQNFIQEDISQFQIIHKINLNFNILKIKRIYQRLKIQTNKTNSQLFQRNYFLNNQFKQQPLQFVQMDHNSSFFSMKNLSIDGISEQKQNQEAMKQNNMNHQNQNLKGSTKEFDVITGDEKKIIQITHKKQNQLVSQKKNKSYNTSDKQLNLQNQKFKQQENINQPQKIYKQHQSVMIQRLQNLQQTNKSLINQKQIYLNYNQILQHQNKQIKRKNQFLIKKIQLLQKQLNQMKQITKKYDDINNQQKILQQQKQFLSYNPEDNTAIKLMTHLKQIIKELKLKNLQLLLLKQKNTRVYQQMDTLKQQMKQYQKKIKAITMILVNGTNNNLDQLKSQMNNNNCIIF